MYLEHTKSKLGSTKAKVCTGRSEVVKRLHRKTGGSIKRSKHGIGGNVLGTLANFLPFAEGGEIKKARGGSIKRSKHGIGGNVLGTLAHFLPFAEGGEIKKAMGGVTPASAASQFSSPAASKFAYKKGKRVKREPHYIGAMLGAASAIPSIISLVNKLRK